MAKSLGRAVKALRQQAGLQANALARFAGLDSGILSRLEREERSDMYLSSAAKLARALGVSLDELAQAAGLYKEEAGYTEVRAQGVQIDNALTQAQRRLKAALEDVARAKAALRRAR